MPFAMLISMANASVDLGLVLVVWGGLFVASLCSIMAQKQRTKVDDAKAISTKKE